jgi:hypothetical protein
MATDRENFWNMLAGATALSESQGQQLTVSQPDSSRIVVETGPDDAAAVFGFTSDGRLKWVSVVEAHPYLEVGEDGG